MKDFWHAQLAAQQIEEKTGLSLREQAEMDLSEWGRLAYGQTPTEAGIAAFNREQDAQQDQTRAPIQSAPQTAPETQGVDIASMDMQTYAQFRAQTGIGQGHKEGRGIFDSVGSRSQGFADATRAQSGRTAYSSANVEPAPRLEGRTVLKRDDHRDYRPAAARFSTPGNSFQL